MNEHAALKKEGIHAPKAVDPFRFSNHLKCIGGAYKAAIGRPNIQITNLPVIDSRSP